MSAIHRLKNFSGRDWFSLLIILFPVAVVVYFVITQTAGTTKPKVVRGHLDLSHWDFEKNGHVPLNGDWSFYWNKLYTPADSIPAAKDFIAVPGIWNGHETGAGKATAAGYATYMLDIDLPENAGWLSLKIQTMSNAYRCWVNDSLLASNGTTGTSEASSKPEYRPLIVPFKPGSGHAHILVQVSNFAHCKGGFWLPAEIGKQEQLQHERDKRVMLEMFLFGSLFILALYHFGLYVLRRKDITPLFFGMMCLIIGIRSLLTGENLGQYMLPDLSWLAARRIEYLLTFLTVPVYITFARRLYPDESNKIMQWLLVGFSFLLCAVALVTPSSFFTRTSYVFTGYSWIASVYTIIVFIMAMRRRREGAAILLATSLFFLLTIVNDTLNQLELIHTGLYLSFGLFVVTFAQAYMLSSRFSNAFTTTEIYASTFQKFVPAQFLDKIAKDGIASIKAGNAEKTEATVMFSDIRSFTGISETMSADAVFGMLNDYLSEVEPPMRANNGFVDKYMGDGIMALFETGRGMRSSTHAVMAALQIQEALKAFNETRHHQHLPPLYTGIGLHTGPVIIGTIGGNERMDSTAIGDAVNLASRIEGMTKMYGVSLLVSDTTVESLDNRDELLLRFVDTVVAKGKKESIGIWEIIGLKKDNRLRAQSAMLPVYEEAMQLYREHRFDDARSRFESCLAIFPGDEVCRIYINRCKQGNSGITKLEEK